MSPKKPIRPSLPGTRIPESPTIRLPDTDIPALPARPPQQPSASVIRDPSTTPSSSAATPGSSGTHRMPEPTESIRVSPVKDTGSTELPSIALKMFSRPAPKGLPPADDNGLRHAHGRTYVDLETGGVTMVRYDHEGKTWGAALPHETIASGPALRRSEGSATWSENRSAMLLRQYQLPLEHRNDTDPINGPFGEGHSKAQLALRRCQERLRSDANAALRSPSYPARPALLPMHAEISPDMLIAHLFEHSKGLVVGEVHLSRGSKEFLIDNMQVLSEQGVKYLYLERLRTDFDQVHLNRLHNDETFVAPLKAHLDGMEIESHAVTTNSYTYRSLVEAAHNHGIEVRALDCAASCHLTPARNYRNHADRTTLMSYHANLLITAQTAGHPNNKWVALVEARHSNDYQRTPGLAEQQGVFGLRIKEVAQGPDSRLFIDSGELDIQADLLLEVRTYDLGLFEIPARYHAPLKEGMRQILNADPFATHIRFETASTPEHAVALEVKIQRRLDLILASERALMDPSPRPARPRLPQLLADSNATQFIDAVYEQSMGIVLGAPYNALGARQFLIDNMPILARNEVKTLYLENLLTDFDQPLLDHFHSSGQMSRDLMALLRRQDELQQMPIVGEHTLQNLIVVAQRNGIRIQGLDSSISYITDLRTYSGERSRQFTYFADRVIEQDQLRDGELRWVALVESEFVSTVRGIPGLADLQGAFGVQVSDVGARPVLQVMIDQGAVISRQLTIEQPVRGRLSANTSHQYVKSDIRLEVNVSATPMPRTLINPRECLHGVDDFLIEEAESGFVVVTRPHGPLSDVEIPIVEAEGRFSINYRHSKLSLVNHVQFRSVADLIWGIESSGLTLAARIAPVPSAIRLDTHPHLQRGMFIFGETANGTVLVNRSKDRSLAVTPIRHDTEGNVYIHHPRWGLSEANTFNDLDGLSEHLISKIGMIDFNATATDS